MAPIFFSLSLSLPSALRSSALHYMQLLPHRTWMNHGNVSFEANLQQKLMTIRGSTECPIFHTINYICDKKYEGKYAEVIRDPAKFEVQNKQACSEYVRKKGIHQNPASVAEMCWQFRFTAAGSENLAIKERRDGNRHTPSAPHRGQVQHDARAVLGNRQRRWEALPATHALRVEVGSELRH